MTEVLWAVREPRWEAVDWPSSPDRGVPGPETVGGMDDAPGWVTALRVGALVWYGHDHYRVTPRTVEVWSDDPDDPPYEPGITRVREAETGVSETAIRHGVWLSDDAWVRVRPMIGAGCACRG